MNWYLDTEYPIALDSYDHKVPGGTAIDNSSNRNFNRKLDKLYDGWQVSVLDLGCAGGGFVESLLEDGHIAVGLEGSDYSLVHKRAAWPVIPGNLFTCDITKPFILHQGDHEPYQFDIVTAWEVVEHIEVDDLPIMFENIKAHLKPSGLFLMTTPYYRGTIKSRLNDHHRTRRHWTWWRETITSFGFEHAPEIEALFKYSWVRWGKIRNAYRRL